MKIKKVIEKILSSIKSFFRKFLMLAMSFASIILLFLFLRWAGIKGLASFGLGMGIMAYLMLSKNLMLAYIIDKTKSGEYLHEIKSEQKTFNTPDKEKEKENERIITIRKSSLSKHKEEERGWIQTVKKKT